MQELAKGTSADLRPQAPILLKFLIPLLNDTDAEVLVATGAALKELLEKRLGLEESLSHLDYMRNVVASVVSDARRRKGGVGDGEYFLPGLNIPGGLVTFISVYNQALLHGTALQKEVAAAWMGELVVLMSPTSLTPYINKVVGPLIRLANDRFPASVKVAIWTTIGLLMEKGGTALRLLAPQLQTTFTKALSDPNASVRDLAASGLGRLMPLSTRIDPLVGELVAGASGAPGGVEVQGAMLQALGQVLTTAGARVSQPVVTKVRAAYRSTGETAVQWAVMQAG